MAPEYLVRGQLTEKADVYSFGVLVLEIVCGRKNSVFTQDSGSLLQRVRFEFFLHGTCKALIYTQKSLSFKLGFCTFADWEFWHQVWKLYKSNKLVEAIDDCLKDDFPEKEASDVLRIGLLCTQASVALRPSMTEVVWMLTHKDWEIPPPNQPPFLNAHVLESAISRSNSANTSMSNMATKIEVSGPFTESSSMHSSMDHQEEQKLMQQKISLNFQQFQDASVQANQ